MLPREPLEAILTQGGRLLALTVQRQVGIRKDGKIRYRAHRTEYIVEQAEHCIHLIKADGTAYTVGSFGCTCMDAAIRGRERQCKHLTALHQLGFFEEIPMSIKPSTELIEAVVVKGDLAQLSAEDRTAYYRAVCESTGLNPLTQPFGYIVLQGRLTLYALKAATDQLRKL